MSEKELPLEPGADWAVWVVYEVSQDGGVEVSEPITGIFAAYETAKREVEIRLENENIKPVTTDELGREFYKSQPSLDIVIAKWIVR